MTKPLIGLTGPSAFSQECMDTIEELFNANFVLLYHSNDANLKYWLDNVDGVWVAGGLDIHPTVYEESIWNNQNLSRFDLKRDIRELSIVEYCLREKKPLLGICRGHQLLGIKFGMGFVMDLACSTICHHPQKHEIVVNRNEPVHSIRLLDTESFYKTYKMPTSPPERQVLDGYLHQKQTERIWVNSFHHQGIAYNNKKQYEGVDIVGVSRVEINATLKEIVEFMHGRTWISVQFHPEYDWKENSVSRSVFQRFKELLAGDN